MATQDRIYIDEEFLPIADQLVKRQIPGTERVEGVFADTKELAVFAAGLGYRKSKTSELKKNGREIKLSAIGKIGRGGEEIVLSLALAVDRTIDVLHPREKQRRAEIFERHMNGGLQYLAGLIDPDRPALDVVALVIKGEHRPSASTDDAIDLIGQRL